jgi:hypothetical protein
MADRQLYGGTMDNFAGSMAEEIEKAFTAVRAEEGKDPVPPENRDDLRLLYIAIARGVINHLKASEQAFAVTVNGTNPASGFPTIGVRPSP